MNTKGARRRSGRPTKKIKPIKDRAHLRGTKYSAAYMLVASGKLSEVQIAELLGVDVPALQEAMHKRYFQEQVESIRKAEAILLAHSFTAPGKLASQMLVLQSQAARRQLDEVLQPVRAHSARARGAME
jgi:hypothetical protein